MPPYELTAAVAVDPDTTWSDFRINNLPLIKHRPVQQSPKTPDPRLRLIMDIQARQKQELANGVPHETRSARMVERYRARQDLVESVAVVSPLEFRVHWRGHQQPTGVRIDPSANFAPDSSGRGEKFLCLERLKSLRRGHIVVFGEMEMYLKPIRLEALEAEIDSLRRGLHPVHPIIPSAAMRDEFRNPW